MRNAIVFWTLVLSSTTACDSGGDQDEEADLELAGGKADGSSFTECQLAAAVAHVNDPATTVDTLLAEHVRSTQARAIVAHRNGPDGVVGTSDDQPFADIVDLDDVPSVGAATIGTIVKAISAKCSMPVASRHVRYGEPRVTGSIATQELFAIRRDQYELSQHRALNGALWVSSGLRAEDFGDAPRFPGPFITDDTLPTGWYRAKHDDYTGTELDRGHMVRSEERTATDADNKATFILTNVLPQTPFLNRGPWLALERYDQALVQRKPHELQVVAGGIFDSSCFSGGSKCPTIGRSALRSEKLAVATDYFKVVAIAEREGTGLGPVEALIAVRMPNDGDIRKTEWSKFLTTVDDIELATNLDFFSELPDELEHSLESKVYVVGDHLGEVFPEELVGCGVENDDCESDLDCCSDACDLEVGACL